MGEEESNLVKHWRKEERGVKMPKYRKKPVIIEAVMWDGSQESAQEINQFNGGKFWAINDNRQMKIPTLEGIMLADVGDYIIKGIKGEFYPCKPDIFVATYEKV
jgi:hypothetical protein